MQHSRTRPHVTGTPAPLIALLLAAWLLAAYGVGESGAFAVGGSQSFRPIVLTALAPLLLFALAWRLSPALRVWVRSLDLELLTQLQLWRVIGFAFLLLYAHDRLPALFAWPAGFGDLAIGLAAPFVAWRLRANGAFAFTRGFRAFHMLGLLDFLVAVVTAALASGAYPAVYRGAITTGPMVVWPLNLFPSFLVPLFILLHLAVFLKLAALRETGGTQG